MKGGIRILALDDASFTRNDKTVLVVGIVGRGDLVEGVLSFRVGLDGNDSTEKLIKSVKSSRFKEQIKLIVINGTTFAGMNVVDITKIGSSLGTPVLGVTRKKPHPKMLKASIIAAKSQGYVKKTEIIDRISKKAKIAKIGGFYVQISGIESDQVSKYIDNSLKLLRLAHIVASGVSKGESKGRI